MNYEPLTDEQMAELEAAAAYEEELRDHAIEHLMDGVERSVELRQEAEADCGDKSPEVSTCCHETPVVQDAQHVPNPGSQAALDLGCTCAVLDNRERPQDGSAGFWITQGCPVHAPSAALAALRPNEEATDE